MIDSVLNVDGSVIKQVARDYVMSLIFSREPVLPKAFFRATRASDTGKFLERPQVISIPVEWETEQEQKQVQAAIREKACDIAAEWIVLVLPGIVTFRGTQAWLAVISIESDSENDVSFLFFGKGNETITEELIENSFQAFDLSICEGNLEHARKRRLDVS